jgi:hypothetical protein
VTGVLKRRVFLAPLRQQLVEGNRIDHGAGQDVRANLGAFLQDHDADVFAFFIGDLFQTDRGGQTCRASADDHHIHVHAFAFAERVLFAHEMSPSARFAVPVSRDLPFNDRQFATFCI